MIPPLVAVLLQVQTSAMAPPAGKPVHVWLGSSGPLLRGQPVRVYVETAADGYLVVLHRRTDGRIEVLFPSNPTADPYVRSGTYEIKSAGDHESFVVAEPDGTGLVLAALSSRSYRFDEFVRAASWKADALVPWWNGADGEGALSDIVQRMLGDGYFNYDIVSYTVVPLPVLPAPLAMQDTTAPPPSPYPLYSTCLDCTFVGFQEIVLAPFGVCDPFLVPCLDNRFSRRHRFPDSGIRSVDVPMNVMALSLGPARSGNSAGLVPPPKSAPLLFKPRAGPTLPPVEVRARVPVQATPLGPGYVTVGVRPARARPARAAFQEVRLTLSPSAPSEAPQSPAQGGGTALVQVSRRAAPPAAGRLVAAAALPRSRVMVAATAQAPPAAPSRSRAVASGGGVTTGEMHGVALPGVTWHAMGSRAAGGGSVAARRR